MRIPRAFTAVALAGALAAAQVNADEQGALPQAVKDGWIDGKLEAVYALNRHLNPFAIHTDVEQGVVHLTGTVDSEIDRDLAVELAKGIEGVVDVDSDLRVDTGHAASAETAGDGGAERSFGTWVDDATTTAAVKAKLVGNSNTSGLQIQVSTYADVVTLSGSVGSDEERQLAEELARNTGDVRDVRNELVVEES